MKAWELTSIAEKELASVIVGELFTGDSQGFSVSLRAFIQKVLNKNKRLFKKYPQLAAARFDKINADDDTEISSNLISQIAYELEAKKNQLDKTGTYFTPNILAKDMVRVAIANWVTHNSSAILGDALQIAELGQEELQQISKPTWFDPCVGGGVFPLQIIEMYSRMGLSAKKLVFAKVFGADINPLFVEATKIRLAAFLHLKEGCDFDEIYHGLNNNIQQGDSLKEFAEKESLFAAQPRTFNIVIGNPPYIRSNKITTKQKAKLREMYPNTWSGSSDLYSYFIALGLNSLKMGGTLCYVSPATFQKNLNGALIRAYIRKFASVDIVFDFDELPVFSQVSTHTSVYLLTKGGQQNKALCRTYQNLPDESPLVSGLADATQIEGVSFRSNWNLNSDSNFEIEELMRKNAIPLESYTRGIYSGIKTGLINAYLLDALGNEEILEDQLSQQYIFPALEPSDIARWKPDWKNKFLIVISNKEDIPEESKIYQYLLNFKDRLSQRSDFSHADNWYSLRDCNYYDLFSEPKIIFPDISTTNRFALDEQGHFLPDGAFFIPGRDDFLLAILNSKLALHYFRNKCASIGNVYSRGRLRFKKTYLSDFPVPATTSSKIKVSLINLVNEIVTTNRAEKEREIDELVLDLYQIPLEYRNKILAQ